MTVLTPEVDAQVQPSEGIGVHAEWTADVVSGASVAVVDAPAANVDAISAASVHDVRHVFGGGARVFDGQSSLAAGYHYAFENDYRSHAVDVSARTELYEHDTALEISYARAFDTVCDAPGASDPALKARLDTSKGCFDDKATDRRERDLAIAHLPGRVDPELDADLVDAGDRHGPTARRVPVESVPRRAHRPRRGAGARAGQSRALRRRRWHANLDQAAVGRTATAGARVP